MKHSVKITILLIGMFFLAQIIGMAVTNFYSPKIVQNVDASGNVTNLTNYNLPYWAEPPQKNNPNVNLISIIISFVFIIGIMFIIMKYKVEFFLRVWFFTVIVLSISITLNAALSILENSSFISFLIALPLAYMKVFKRNIIIHNTTELMIYPGIAAILVPLLNVFAIIVLFIIISLYDIYAVWHSGFMQKMAKYQIKNLKIFSGFFIPYLRKKERDALLRIKSKNLKNKRIKVNIAILGGGDIVFPIVFSGIVLHTFGFIPAFFIAVGATAALAYLLHISEKGKFYPAMPYISIGCFIALAIAYLLNML